MKMSTGVEAMKMPLRPPMTNMATKAKALSMGTVKRIFPPQSVPSQLNVLIADGTAMTIVDSVNAMPTAGFIPLTNMWCPYTIQERKQIASMEETMAW